jgi:hypothetical protein
VSFSRCWRSSSLSVRVGGEGRGTRTDFVFKVLKYYRAVSVLRQTVLVVVSLSLGVEFMSLRVSSFLLLTVLLGITGCSAPQTRVPVDVSATPPASNNPTPQVEITSQGSSKLDWFDALEIFAQRFPTYAGYAFASDRSQLIIFTTDNRSDNARKIRDSFVALIDQSTGFPELTDAQGKVINPRTLPFTYERARYSRRNLNKWRGDLRELLFTAAVNRLSITDQTNLINAQVADADQQRALMEFMLRREIPIEALNITLGTNVPSKTLYDTFTPPVGGVNIQYGPTIDQRCTLGLPVLANNVASYLTASHCSQNWGTSNDGTVITQNAVKIGDKGLDNPLISCSSVTVGSARCQSADTAIFTAVGSFSRGRIIQTTGGTGSIQTGTTGDTYYDVTTISERPAAGTTVSSIGASTGFRDATVVDADTDVVYRLAAPALPIVIKRVISVNRATSSTTPAACGGDSGGPWFQITGTNAAKFLGITTGATTDAPPKVRPDGLTVDCGYTAYFVPIAQIRVAYPNTTFTFTR